MTATGVSNEGKRLIASVTLPFVLATVTFTLRLISRWTTRKLGVDDWCWLFAFVTYVALFITSIIWATNGYLGWPQATLEPAQLESYLKISFGVEMLYTLVSPAVKLSFILFYSRILEAKTLRIALIVVVTAIMAWFFGAFFATILQCTPVEAYWQSNGRQFCIDQRDLQLGLSSTNVVLNAIIILMPLPSVWSHELYLGQQLVIFAMLGLGSMITIFSVLRAYYLAQIDPLNITGTSANAAIWTTIEPGMVIFCSNLPALVNLVLAYRNAARARQFSPTASKSDVAEGHTRQSMRQSLRQSLRDSSIFAPRQYERLPPLPADRPRDAEHAWPGQHEPRATPYLPPDGRSDRIPQSKYAYRPAVRTQKEFTIYSWVSH